MTSPSRSRLRTASTGRLIAAARSGLRCHRWAFGVRNIRTCRESDVCGVERRATDVLRKSVAPRNAADLDLIPEHLDGNDDIDAWR